MEDRPCTPPLSVALRALIDERNILTQRSKVKVLRGLDDIIHQNQEEIKQSQLRSRAIEEIFTSEESYLKQLEIAMKFFKKPLQESKYVLPAAIKSIFGNLESVYNVNGELLNQLNQSGDDVAAAFRKVAPFFKLYSVYAYDYRHGIAALQDLPKTNSKLDAFIKRQETRPEVGTKLISLLIAPVQRIPRYRLLLKELLAHTPQSDPQYQSILDALKEVESANEHINGLVSEQENMQRIVELQKSLTGGKPTLVHPGRKLIKEGMLMKVSKCSKKSQPRYFILMSDIIMYCKVTGSNIGEPGSLRCSCVLPLRRCFVQQIMSDKAFSLTCHNVSLVLYSDEPYCSESWITTIKMAIQKEEEGRQTLRRRGSGRPPLYRKDFNLLPEASTPRKRKQYHDEIEEVWNPFHSPWKRNRVNSTCEKPKEMLSDESQEKDSKKSGGYFTSIKKALSNISHSLHKYWLPLYARGAPNERRITQN